MAWSTGIGDSDAASVAYVVGMLALCGAVLFGTRACSYSECNAVCATNGDRGAWTWTQGCFCRDAEGLYNPKDSRELPR